MENSRDLQGAPSFPRSVREDGDFDFRAQEQSKPNSPPVLPTKRRGEVAEAAAQFAAVVCRTARVSCSVLRSAVLHFGSGVASRAFDACTGSYFLVGDRDL